MPLFPLDGRTLTDEKVRIGCARQGRMEPGQAGRVHPGLGMGSPSPWDALSGPRDRGGQARAAGTHGLHRFSARRN